MEVGGRHGAGGRENEWEEQGWESRLSVAGRWQARREKKLNQNVCSVVMLVRIVVENELGSGVGGAECLPAHDILAEKVYGTQNRNGRGNWGSWENSCRAAGNPPKSHHAMSAFLPVFPVCLMHSTVCLHLLQETGWWEGRQKEGQRQQGKVLPKCR